MKLHITKYMAGSRRFIIYAGIIMLLLSCETTFAQTVSYVKGSTIKIEQLIGDTDRQRKSLTSNLTYTKYKLKETDLGVPFTHNGKTFVLFGDVPGNDRDPIAYSTDINLNDGFKLDFVTNNNGHWKPITIPGITMGAYQVPLDGISWKNIMYIYFCTDYNSSVGFSTRSVLAKSQDDGKTFTKLYDVSTSKFINISVVKSKTIAGFSETAGRDVQLMFGSGKYRASNVYLAYQLSDNIGIKRMKYFTGLSGGIPQWSTDEANAVALFNQPCVGELSVSYNAFIEKWIMLYNCENPRGINCRTADKPWGPWSSPFIIFDPWGDDGYCHFMHADWNFSVCDTIQDPDKDYVWGGEYGPYQFEDFARGDSTQTTIYFTMSTWNPYTSILMRSKLKVTNSPQFTIEDLKAEVFNDGNFSLSWKTTNEESIESFIAESSRDGSLFEEVEVIRPQKKLYHTAIVNHEGYKYFRVKATDKDGNIYYSVPVVADAGLNLLPSKIFISPNPFNDYLRIAINTASSGKWHIEIKSIEGKTMLQKSFEVIKGTKNYLQVHTPDLQKGTYILTVNSGHSFNSYKVIKK